LSGGTSIEIVGSGFIAGSTVCLFGPAHNDRFIESSAGVLVPAEVVNSTVLRCTAPRLPTAAVPGSVNTEGSVRILVSSNNGANFGPSSARFQYVRMAHLVGLFPSVGPETGGTSVRIRSDGFAWSSAAACIFSFASETTANNAVAFSEIARVQARRISALELECIAPASTGGSGIARVAVTTNG